MKSKFSIEPLKFETIESLPNSWTNENYKELLDLMEYSDISSIIEDDLREMCLMSLTDYEKDEAAELLLKYVFENRLSSGQISNLSHEMQDDKMWEEYSDPALHEEFFAIGGLLYNAFIGKFPRPEAAHFKIRISTKDADDLQIFDSTPETFLVRILAKGMPENTLINRLFKDELGGASFPQANNIIWQLKNDEKSGNSIIVTIISSMYWFHDFKYTEDFEAEISFEKEAT